MYRHPIVAVEAIIMEGDKTLLVKRRHEPYKGFWSFPGGSVNFGEKILEALKREVLEETGLEVECEKLVCVAESIVRDEEMRTLYHYLILGFLARIIGGKLCASSDAEAIEWVPLTSSDKYRTTPVTKELLNIIRRESPLSPMFKPVTLFSQSKLS